VDTEAATGPLLEIDIDSEWGDETTQPYSVDGLLLALQEATHDPLHRAPTARASE